MADKRISSFVDLSAIAKEKEAFLAYLDEVRSRYESLSGVKLKFGDAKTTKEFSDALKQFNEQVEKSSKTAAQDTKNALAAARAKREEAAARKLAADAAAKEALAGERRATSARKEAIEIEKQRVSRVKEADATAKAASAYEQLKQRYTIAANVAKELGARNDKLTNGYKEAQAQAAKLNAELLALERSVGQNQRDVGNYAAGFSGLGNSLNQITRELPSFANSIQTGFLAISNNLPILFDNISATKREIAALRAEGKQVPGVLSQFGSALFSVGTALSLGVTLLTVYGKDIVEFIGSLFKGTEALDKFAEKQRAIGEAFKQTDVKQVFQDVEKVGAAFRLASQGVISKEEALKVYNSTLGDTFGKTNSLEEAEKKFIANSENYVKATILRAAAQQAYAKAADAALAAQEAQFKKEEELLTLGDKFKKFGVQNSSSAPGFVPGANNTTQDRANAEKFARQQTEVRRQALIKQQKEIEDLNRKIGDELIKQSQELAKGITFAPLGDTGGKADKNTVKFYDDSLKYISDKLKEASKIEALSLEDRRRFRQEAYKKDLEILKGQQAAEIANADNDAKAIAGINLKYSVDRLRLADQLKEDLLDIGASYLQRKAEQNEQELALYDEQRKAIEEADKAAIESELKRMDEKLSKRVAYLDQGRDIELKALEVRKTKGEISEEEYQKERLRLTTDYAAFRIQAEIEYTEALIKLNGTSAEAEAKLAALKLKLAQTTNEKIDKEDKDAKEKLEKRLRTIQQLGNETINLLESAITGAYDRQKNAIQEQIDLLEEKKRKDIEVANATIQNEQDRAARIAVINARAEAEKERLERRKRELDQQKARFERAASIARIVQETAINVVRYFGTPLSVISAIIGAAQIAAILAQPIPKYKTGRKGGPAELAIVGDGGVPEIIEGADGSLRVTPSSDTLVALAAGDKVHPDAESFLKSASALSNRRVDLQPVKGSEGDPDVVRTLRSIQQTIANKRENYITLTDKGFRHATKSAGGWTEYVNANVRN